MRVGEFVGPLPHRPRQKLHPKRATTAKEVKSVNLWKRWRLAVFIKTWGHTFLPGFVAPWPPSWWAASLRSIVPLPFVWQPSTPVGAVCRGISRRHKHNGCAFLVSSRCTGAVGFMISPMMQKVDGVSWSVGRLFQKSVKLLICDWVLVQHERAHGHYLGWVRPRCRCCRNRVDRLEVRFANHCVPFKRKVPDFRDGQHQRVVAWCSCR